MITPLFAPRHDLGRVITELREVLDKHSGSMSLAEALGILEILKNVLIEEVRNEI